MNSRSVIISTHQLWKFYLVVIAVALGALLVFWGIGALVINRSDFVYQIISGFSLGILGVVFGAFTIKVSFVHSALILDRTNDIKERMGGKISNSNGVSGLQIQG